MAKILVIDDEKSIRRSLKDIFEFEEYEVQEAEDGKIGLELALKENFDVIFCDIKMPRMDGMEVLEKLIENGVDSPVIMISGHGNIETAVDAIKMGAYDFIEKPLDLNRILVTIRNAKDKSSLITETKVLKQKISKTSNDDIVGESEGIMEVKKMIAKVGPSNARVLITGANGTGKELVSQQLHKLSTRSKLPLIEVNCAAIPTELIESELFGHEKGAFTSANKMKKGKFELADGGTLFLDEIGDMSLSAQAKVLRALQENKITRVGGEKDIKVDVRIFAATNKNLVEEIEKGNFREDLYHRLSVILIKVPTLNERQSDIPLLANHFMSQICAVQGVTEKKFTDGAMKAMKNVNWSGNIRELRNIIERLIILCDDEITEEDIKLFANPKG